MDKLSLKRSLSQAFPALQLPDLRSLSGEKNTHVETLRGVAIILVVTGHMIGYSRTGGMRVEDDSFLRYLYYTLEYVRLPLFTVISGWVYANKPLSGANRSRFVGGKLRRLLVPMFVISTLLFLFRMVVPGTNSKPEILTLPKILVFPYDVYWYLFSLFLIFVFISFTDTTAFLKTASGWATALILSFVLLFISERFLDPVPNLFSFKGALYLLPFFLTGIGIFRFPEIVMRKVFTIPLVVIFMAGIAIQQYIWFANLPLPGKQTALGITVGISAALLLFRMKFVSGFLIWVGGYAYGIFLFHIFFTGGSRIALMRLGVTDHATLLLVGVVAAIGLSILVVRVVERTGLSSLLLGRRPSDKNSR